MSNIFADKADEQVKLHAAAALEAAKEAVHQLLQLRQRLTEQRPDVLPLEPWALHGEAVRFMLAIEGYCSRIGAAGAGSRVTSASTTLLAVDQLLSRSPPDVEAAKRYIADGLDRLWGKDNPLNPQPDGAA